MADNINLRESEYQAIVSELSNMQTTQLQSAAEIMLKLRILVLSDDTFNANLTSKKIIDMLNTLNVDILALLQKAFDNSITGIENMISSTVAMDAVSN